MTIYLNNSLPTTCSYCNERYKKGEVEDTAKVVQLACHHFFHKQCIASKFLEDEDNGRDLTCHSCKQISIPKRASVNFKEFTLEDLTAHFSSLREDPYYRLQPDFLDALNELENRLDSVGNLIRTILFHIHKPNPDQLVIETAFKDWIRGNIPPQLQFLCGKIIADFFSQDGVLTTVFIETEYLSSIEPNSRFQRIPEEGVPVFDNLNDREFKMRVSKDYMLRRVNKNYQSHEKIVKTIVYTTIALVAGVSSLFFGIDPS